MNPDIVPEDEYQHTPVKDPLWWENYHFNGYDPATKIGITTYTAIKPFSSTREEIIVIHLKNPLLFHDQKNLGENALKSESLAMEPVQLLRKWRIKMKDSVQPELEPSLAQDVEFDLLFESAIEPFGFTTERGTRYEQPGVLKGVIHIGGNPVTFCGKGIRDHSWEIRYMPDWGRWYVFMGYTGSGFVRFSYMNRGDQKFLKGWMRTDCYSEITDVQIHPAGSNDVSKKWSIGVKTSDTTLEIVPELISSVPISMGAEQKKSKAVETLVEFGSGGHGFLWYGV